MPLHLHVTLLCDNSPSSLVDEIAISSGNGVKGLEICGSEKTMVELEGLNENASRLMRKSEGLAGEKFWSLSLKYLRSPQLFRKYKRTKLPQTGGHLKKYKSC